MQHRYRQTTFHQHTWLEWNLGWCIRNLQGMQCIRPLVSTRQRRKRLDWLTHLSIRSRQGRVNT